MFLNVKENWQSFNSVAMSQYGHDSTISWSQLVHTVKRPEWHRIGPVWEGDCLFSTAPVSPMMNNQLMLCWKAIAPEMVSRFLENLWYHFTQLSCICRVCGLGHSLNSASVCTCSVYGCTHWSTSHTAHHRVPTSIHPYFHYFNTHWHTPHNTHFSKYIHIFFCDPTHIKL